MWQILLIQGSSVLRATSKPITIPWFDPQNTKVLLTKDGINEWWLDVQQISMSIISLPPISSPINPSSKDTWGIYSTWKSTLSLFWLNNSMTPTTGERNHHYTLLCNEIYEVVCQFKKSSTPHLNTQHRRKSLFCELLS